MPELASREELIERIRALENEVAQSKVIEKQLHKSEDLLRIYIANTPLSVVMCDKGMRWIAYSQQVIIDYQLEQKNYVGEWHYDIVPDLPDHWKNDHRKALAGARIRVEEEKFYRKNGRVAWARREILPWRDADGKIGGIIIFNEIITKRKLAEEALRKLQIQQEALLNNIPDIAWLKDKDSCLIAVNDAFAAAAKAKPVDLVGKTDFDIWPRKLAEKYRADDLDVIHTNQRKTVDELVTVADGQQKWLETIKSPIYDDIGRVIGTAGIARDITRHKRIESALHAEKERLIVTLRSIGDGVITTDKTGRITLVNRIAENLTGWKEADAVGKPLERVFRIVNEVTRQPCANPVHQVIAEGKIVGMSNNAVLIGKDGRETAIADSGAPIMDSENHLIGVVLVFRDVTETRRMEKEILKFEKLESLGVLAGGIAHDFNNFLAGIIGNLSLAKLEADVADSIYDHLQEMEKAAMRAKNLTHQLLTFSKGGEPVRKATDLAHLVKESAIFAVRGSSVRCEVDFGSESLIGDVDEGQIVQVIHNLILNAVQAMPEGGVINIGGERIDISAGNSLTLDAGPYVTLSIEDYGTGIKKEHLQKIFDPYFTTKQKGSGLGLAIAHSVIEKHNGRITVESKLGVGTTYFIYLPAITEKDSIPRADRHFVVSGGGRVLVMDDEDFICKLASNMLKRMGYDVTTAKDGEEAIRRYRQAFESGLKIDAVILDLTVPGAMGGKEAIKKLLEIDPEVNAIVSSGYSNDPVLSDYARYGFRQAVSKPYRIQDLSNALSAIFKT